MTRNKFIRIKRVECTKTLLQYKELFMGFIGDTFSNLSITFNNLQNFVHNIALIFMTNVNKISNDISQNYLLINSDKMAAKWQTLFWYKKYAFWVQPYFNIMQLFPHIVLLLCWFELLHSVQESNEIWQYDKMTP